VIAGFVDGSVNRLLSLDTRREVSLALVPLGYAPGAEAGLAPDIGPLSLKTVPISGDEMEFPAINEMHEASSLGNKEEVATWRGEARAVSLPHPSGHLVPLDPYPDDEMAHYPIESVITRRGSARRFSHESITFRQLSTVLQSAAQGTPTDFLGPRDGSLYDIYLIVNAVDGLASGSYVFHKDLEVLELLEEGEFRQQAGCLGLQQALPADASVDIFLLSDLGPILELLGNRGYRAAQLDASITAGKIYLAAYAQNLGATGLTFYDDEVTNFFSPHAQGKSVMFLVALGKLTKRSLVNVDTNRLRSKPGQ
jgi:nitroreductase